MDKKVFAHYIIRSADKTKGITINRYKNPQVNLFVDTKYTKFISKKKALNVLSKFPRQNLHVYRIEKTITRIEE